MAGFPGTRAAMWQQLGRAGRGAQDALGILIARDDPLDTYLVHHPEALLGRPVEATVFDPANPYVLGPAPVRGRPGAARSPRPSCPASARAPATWSGPSPRPGCCADAPTGWFWTDRRRAADLADIRSGGGPQVQLVEAETGRVVGTVDGGRAHGTAHAGAVYVHRGETWLVESLDLEEHVAVIDRADPTTPPRRARSPTSRSCAEREHRTWGECRLSLGEVDVSHQVVSFLMRRQPERRGDRRGAARPARSARCAPPPCGGRCPPDALAEAGLATARPARARRTPPSTARSACCRSSRPATAGTSAGSPPPCTPTPAG